MKAKDTYVRARVNKRLKRDSERIFHRLGMSTTEAIRLFLAQVRLREGLPFRVELHPSGDQNDDILLPKAMRQAAMDVIDEG